MTVSFTQYRCCSRFVWNQGELTEETPTTNGSHWYEVFFKNINGNRASSPKLWTREWRRIKELAPFGSVKGDSLEPFLLNLLLFLLSFFLLLLVGNENLDAPFDDYVEMMASITIIEDNVSFGNELVFQFLTHHLDVLFTEIFHPVFRSHSLEERIKQLWLLHSPPLLLDQTH